MTEISLRQQAKKPQKKKITEHDQKLVQKFPHALCEK